MAKIEDGWRSLDDLRPNLANYNRHEKAGVIEKMAARIRVNCFSSPFIITPDNLILGGHLRRLGLLKLRSDNYPEPEGIRPGWQVPVRVFTGTPTQEKALLVGDNPDPADIEFDNEALASLLAELQADGALEGSGYDADALDRLIGEVAGEADNPGGGVDPNAEWEGMPEFIHEDKTAFQSIALHFKDQTAVDQFAELVCKNISPKTKYLWFPDDGLEPIAGHYGAES